MSERNERLEEAEHFEVYTPLEVKCGVGGGLTGLLSGIYLAARSSNPTDVNSKMRHLHGQLETLRSIEGDVYSNTPAQRRPPIQDFLNQELNHKKHQIKKISATPSHETSGLLMCGEIFGPTTLLAFVGAALACGVRYRLFHRKQEQAKLQEAYEKEASIDRIVENETGPGLRRIERFLKDR
jgi:hypothetical protein